MDLDARLLDHRRVSARRGVATSVAVTVPPVLGNQKAGFDISRGVVLFVLTKDSIPTTNLADITLLWESDAWKLVSLDLRS